MSGSKVVRCSANESETCIEKRFSVLVPAYEPNEALQTLIEELLARATGNSAFAGIVVVNDGSVGPQALQIFDNLRTLGGVRVLEHAVNAGKGAALKTGFSYLYENQTDVDFIVTADADGQHAPVDVMRLAERAIATGNPNIGCRHFSQGVPWRSRFGNWMTARVFRLTTGQSLRDTQSGLRTYRRVDLPQLLDIQATRYDYEFHCLFHQAKRIEVPLQQVPIETIYEPGNPTSHFNPLLDSVRIYAVLLRYVSVSALSALLDFLLFSLLTTLDMSIGPALVAARIGSMPLYFYGMRNVVFRSKGRQLYQVAGTLLLMAVHVAFLWMFISYLEVAFGVHPALAMVLGASIFYVGTFLVQKYIIYRAPSKPAG